MPLHPQKAPLQYPSRCIGSEIPVYGKEDPFPHTSLLDGFDTMKIRMIPPLTISTPNIVYHSLVLVRPTNLRHGKGSLAWLETCVRTTENLDLIRELHWYFLDYSSDTRVPDVRYGTGHTEGNHLDRLCKLVQLRPLEASKFPAWSVLELLFEKITRTDLRMTTARISFHGRTVRALA